jgi:methylated-DNA-[protein]-cysteine S-methyltransferase
MTPFAKRVYRIVSAIPLGQVRSYRWVARKAGCPFAARAVGQALRKNPFPLIIPCHRVINADGNLGGYSGGVKVKRRLLELEKEIRALILTTKKK